VIPCNGPAHSTGARCSEARGEASHARSRPDHLCGEANGEAAVSLYFSLERPVCFCLRSHRNLDCPETKSDLDSSKVSTKTDLKEIDHHLYARDRSKISRLVDHTSAFLDLHPIPANCCTTNSTITLIREKKNPICSVINLAL
jgi:hypothetical protein